MKQTSKLIVTIGMVFSMLLIAPTPSKADITGAGDAALLAQQIYQCWQDFELDKKKWIDITQRFNQVKSIANTITKGTQAYSSIHNILKTTNQVITTGQRIESYIEYLEDFGDDFRITRARSIYSSFMRRTSRLNDDITKTLKSFESLTDLKPLEILNAMDEATAEFSAAVSDMSEKSTDDILQLCLEVATDQVVENNRNFIELNIRS